MTDFDKGMDAYKKGDYKIAFRELKPLAEQGHPEAQYYVGGMHDRGLGTCQDLRESTRLLKLSAKNGFAKAQHNLGVMYNDGTGVLRNNVLAYMWISLAMENGIKESKKAIDILVKEMTLEQIEEAQRLVQEYKAKNHKGG